MVAPKDEPRAAWADKEESAAKRRRMATIMSRLDTVFPVLKTALDHRNPFELLVATILSAQSTDKKINEISPALFKRFPTAVKMAASKPGELEVLVKQSGFFNQKAKNLRAMSHQLVAEFGGEVPPRMEDLITLPGVARKTANVVLSNAFGIDVGIAVDTHVHRLSRRLALSESGDPVGVEKDLMALVPSSKWCKVSHLLIEHGRATCHARSPRCEDCAIAKWCPSARFPGRPVGMAPGHRSS